MEKAAKSKMRLKLNTQNKIPPDFGEDMRREEFGLKEGRAFLAHSTVGCVPRQVLEEQCR